MDAVQNAHDRMNGGHDRDRDRQILNLNRRQSQIEAKQKGTGDHNTGEYSIDKKGNARLKGTQQPARFTQSGQGAGGK